MSESATEPERAPANEGAEEAPGTIVLTPEEFEANSRLLDACFARDLGRVRQLVEEEDADLWFQAPDTQNGPLHEIVRGTRGVEEEDAALGVLEYVLSSGAVWNQLNGQDKMAACMAREQGLLRVYDALVSAGVRAELLLGMMARKTKLSARNEAYLAQRLEYRDVAQSEGAEESRVLVDAGENGVMMTWEREIMHKSSDMITQGGRSGLRLLNIGFGLGIIDTLLQATQPELHVIVEAHPDVLAEMRRTGWYDKPNVRVLEGRWSDVEEDIYGVLADGRLFDGIYYDPFGEDYADLQAFYEVVVNALDADSGVFSFFNGLGADRQTVYDVYCALVPLDVQQLGLACEFTRIPVARSDAQDREWEGIAYKYWQLADFQLPRITFAV